MIELSAAKFPEWPTLRWALAEAKIYAIAALVSAGAFLAVAGLLYSQSWTIFMVWTLGGALGVAVFSRFKFRSRRLSEVYAGPIDHQENDDAEYVDLRIFVGDSPAIINEKLVLAYARPVSGADPDKDAYCFACSLGDVPAEYRLEVRRLFRSWIRRHEAKFDSRDPDLYLMHQGLIRDLARAIGSYERNLKPEGGATNGRRLVFSPGGEMTAAANGADGLDSPPGQPEERVDIGPFARRGSRPIL